jgi:hypothetical protein
VSIIVGSGSVAAAFFMGVMIPLTTQNPAAFSARGQIWLGSLAAWPQMPWLGGGPDYYRSRLDLFNAMGTNAVHGHNLFVNTLTAGGVLGIATMFLLLVGVFIRARRFMPIMPVPLIYVLALAIIGVLEVSFDFGNLGAYGYAVWIPIAIVIFGRDQSTTVQVGPDILDAGGRVDQDIMRVPSIPLTDVTPGSFSTPRRTSRGLLPKSLQTRHPHTDLVRQYEVKTLPNMPLTDYNVL